MVKKFYSRFFAAAPGRLHFAAHSHHPWPDVTREAQLEAWDDAARFADLKWSRILGAVAGEAREHIARTLDLPDSAQIAFAPNTHEFVVRLLSCFPPNHRVRIVTTDSEFLSFSRQISRLEEEDLVAVVRIATEPFETFGSRFIHAVQNPENDLIFLSQVFFNSGFVVRDLEAIADAAPSRSMIVIDGYHGFFAVPTRLRTIADRIFYMAGGYKYAQSGEGVCFLAAPGSFELRPRNTGWFAGFGSLQTGSGGSVPFSSDGARLMGATFDPVGLYRFNAVAKLFQSAGVTVDGVHAHVKRLQARFLTLLSLRTDAAVRGSDLIAPPLGLEGLGHFLTFRRNDAGRITERLAARNVIVDSRGDRLRFGFGAYHDENDVQALVAHL